MTHSQKFSARGITMRSFTVKVVAAAALSLTWPLSAHAEDLCRARALRDISPIGGGSYVIPKGDFVTAVTQYQVDAETGERSFCSHGGGCYPEHVTVAGRGSVRALELVNCVVGRQIGVGLYSVQVDRRRNSSTALRFDDVENQLISFGMGIAPADNAARHYIRNPAGACGRLVKQALEGNPDARSRLARNPAFCTYNYRRNP